MSDQGQSKDDVSAKILQEAKERFALAEEAERDNRDAAEDDIRFARLGEQWDEDLKKSRLNDGRPCLTINKLPPFIRQVVNDARQNKPQIRVLPQDSNADPETAEIFSGLIRNIESSSDADVAYDTALDNAATGGFGYFRINLEYAGDDSWDQDIRFERIADPFSVLGDPHATSADGSDWNTAFVTERMSKAEYERRFKDGNPVDWQSAEARDSWIDDDQVTVAEYWKREEVRRQIQLLSDGSVVDLAEYEEQRAAYDLQQIAPEGEPRTVASHKVTQYLLSGVEVLSKTEWPGRFIPIIPVYGEEVNYKGRRYFRSLVRDAKDAQVMYNAWRTASTELVALAPKAPFIGRTGAFDTDVEKWETANVQSHAFIEYDGAEAPQRQPFAGVPAGALQEALNASDDMKSIIGIYDASLGARSNETSGRAIMARQRESDVSTFHFIDNLARSIKHAGRILIDLIPKVYGPDRIIRVLGEDPQDVRNVELAEPEAAMANRAERQAAEGNAELLASLPAVYSLSVGKYDLAVSSGPSFTTRREESATQMVELIRAYPAAAPVLGDLLAKNLDWPGADKIAERLQQAAQGQGGNPAEAQAKMAEMQIKAAETQAQAQAENEKLRLEWFKAETDRMKVVHEARQPAELPTGPF